METRKSTVLSVIVAAYNEEKNIEYAVYQIVSELRSLIPSFEILIVNDGSADRTGEIADSLSRKIREVRTIHHSENRGPGSGIHTALPQVRGEWTIFIPADIGMDLKELPKYLEASKCADIVVGNRSDRRDYPLYRKFVSVANIFLIKFLFGMKEHQFNYISLYRSEVLKEIRIRSKGVFITAEIMIKAKRLGYGLKEINVTYVPRTAGTASCGKPRIILRTISDMLRLWMRYKN